MNRIERRFKELKKRKKKAFIAFITAGYPSLDVTKRLVLEFAKTGVDVVELGVPFSDPLADGPVIQESSQRALKNKVNLDHILRLVRELRIHTDIPIALMTYYNPIFCFGEKEFARKASAAGVDGVIVPDLPPDEGKSLLKLANKHKLDVICFISPTTSRKRIKYIAKVSRGFIYYVSLTGVTGARSSLPSDLISHIRSVKRAARKPVCVGFGISSPKQVKAINKAADGVIVGSAIIKKIKANIGRPDLVKKVSKFIQSLQ
ncbi:tryptophan synthase subunit alpha [Candidatus Omnitrophota bacterium]